MCEVCKIFDIRHHFDIGSTVDQVILTSFRHLFDISDVDIMSRVELGDNFWKSNRCRSGLLDISNVDSLTSLQYLKCWAGVEIMSKRPAWYFFNVEMMSEAKLSDSFCISSKCRNGVLDCISVVKMLSKVHVVQTSCSYLTVKKCWSCIAHKHWESPQDNSREHTFNLA